MRQPSTSSGCSSSRAARPVDHAADHLGLLLGRHVFRRPASARRSGRAASAAGRPAPAGRAGSRPRSSARAATRRCSSGRQGASLQAKEPLVAVRLPGHFSVRGDWFLAISGGSRSIRQAERALDLLNSRRANVARLQMGIGLPTRGWSGNESSSGILRTKLVSQQRGQEGVPYGTFLKIQANNGRAGRTEDGFYWLWRNSLHDYAHWNRIWHKWLYRTLLWWHGQLLRYKSVWINSFDVYDLLTNDPPKKRTNFAPPTNELPEIEKRVWRATSLKEKEKEWKKYKALSHHSTEGSRGFSGSLDGARRRTQGGL